MSNAAATSAATLTNSNGRKPLTGIVAQMRPGHRPHGRRKGTPNRCNGDIKRLVVGALELAGGVQYLCDQAHKNPVAFLGLLGRVLPLQVAGADGGKLHVTYSWADGGNEPHPAGNA